MLPNKRYEHLSDRKSNETSGPPFCRRKRNKKTQKGVIQRVRELLDQIGMEGEEFMVSLSGEEELRHYHV